MKKKFSLYLAILAGILFSVNLFGQTDTVKGKDEVIINGKHYKAIEEKKKTVEPGKKKQIPLDSEFVIKNNRFRYYNNWFTIGGGVQKNISYNRSLGFTGGADFNFHIKRNYFQAGAMMNGENVNFITNYQAHLGFGLRFEDKDVMLAGFAGPTFSTGYAKVGDTVYTRPYNVAGLYFQGDIIRKLTYDVGIGASLFVDWNPEETLTGIRFILYFSGSYKGQKHHTYTSEDSFN